MICLAVPALAQTPPDPLRGLIWNLPAEAVRDFENAAFVGADEGVMVYHATVRPDPDKRPFDVMIEYGFDAKGLRQIRYEIALDRGDPRAGMDDVLTWQLWLDEAFNQTSTPRLYFRAANVRRDPERWGWAIYRGGGNVRIDWQDAESRAVLSLTGRNDTPRFLVTLTPADRASRP